MKDIETKEDYALYQEVVADFFKNEGVTNLSIIYNEEESTEPYFSWQNCECCKRSLAGNRYDCNGYNPTTKEIQDYVVCEDCVYYVEYGQLDDMTMMKIAAS